jgi:hypothetical protein
MKKILATILLLVMLGLGIFNTVKAYVVRVKSYYKPSIGRYIMPSYRTSPNSTKWDNWITKGNYNPYTGKKGYKNPFGW